MKIISTFMQWELNESWVLLRADLNVPLSEGLILDDTRLQELEPTFKSLIKKNARVILLTHLGRPEKHDPALSTRILLSWFTNRGYDLEFAEDMNALTTLQKKSSCRLIVFENVRFFPFEKSPNAPEIRQLAACASYYINDAFGSLHRTDASICQLPLYFDRNHRSIGLLIERELRVLQPLRDNPQPPFLLIMGGAKLETKLPLIRSMIRRATYIALLPALSFAMDRAQGKNIGQSSLEKKDADRCTDLLKILHESSTQLIMPTDYIVEDHAGTLHVVSNFNTDASSYGISIGPKSEEHLRKLISLSSTIIMNGISGFHDKPETLKPMCRLFASIGASSATSLIAGGDTVAALTKCGTQGITHISTGGGATLSYLAGQKLPGLVPFIQES